MLLLVFEKGGKEKSLRSTGCMPITATCLLASFLETVLFLQNTLEMLQMLYLMHFQFHLGRLF